ncbi:MAG: 5'-methylthioadenosine/adenosylhomocysteine nucleosidase [Bacteroidaceae bacterium]|nr:5'-methylthioadenosine/adenosylhomocysteine nucleosidase [Bacteroidaceae bacterium]
MAPISTIGILAAMSVECRQVETLLNEKRCETFGPHTFNVGRLGGITVVLQQCGIGKVNAASGVTNLINRYHPDAVISSGCAGGIDASLRVGDVVASVAACHHDVYCGEDVERGQVQGLPRFFAGDERLLNVATHLQSEVRVMPGLICSGDRFVTDRSELDAIKALYPDGMAVDMESAAIAQVCHLYQVPFLSFRVISDTPGVEAHFQQYLNFWDTMAEKSFTITKQFLENIQ